MPKLDLRVLTCACRHFLKPFAQVMHGPTTPMRVGLRLTCSAHGIYRVWDGVSWIPCEPKERS